MTPPLEFDVCVIGAGPAGATTAARLARLGYRVGLVGRHRAPRISRVESISTHALPLLAELGVDLEAGPPFGLCTPAPAFAELVEAEPRQGTNHVLNVDRAQFDRRLLAAACAQGVHWLPCESNPRVRHSGAGHWQLPGDIDWRETIHARFLVDAAGRGGAIKRQRVQTAARTLAITGCLATVGDVDRLPGLEAIESGWLWSVPTRSDGQCVTLFCDAGDMKSHARQSLAAWYRSCIARTTSLRKVSAGELLTKLCVRDVTATAVSESIAPDWLKVGDADVCIDPLASQGIHLAVSSGFAAAAVLNTMLANHRQCDLAMAFYRERQQDLVETHRRHAAEVYRRLAEYYPTEFWTRRAHEDRLDPPRESERAYFHPEIIVKLSSEVDLVTTGVLVDDRIEARAAIKHHRWPRAIAFLEGVPVSLLVRDLATPRTARALTCGWSREMPLATAVKICDWLWRHHLLIACEIQQPLAETIV